MPHSSIWLASCAVGLRSNGRRPEDLHQPVGREGDAFADLPAATGVGVPARQQGLPRLAESPGAWLSRLGFTISGLGAWRRGHLDLSEHYGSEREVSRALRDSGALSVAS